MSIYDQYNLDLPAEKRMVIDARIEKRFFGFALDLLFIYIVLLAPLTRLFPARDVTFSNAFAVVNSLPAGLVTVFATSVGLVMVLYFSLFEHYLGFTPGMRLMGLQTYTLSFSQAVVRNIFVVPIFPLSLLFLLELYYLFTRKQRFLEWASNTKTIEILTYSTT